MPKERSLAGDVLHFADLSSLLDILRFRATARLPNQERIP
jgi:hypothetical protein